NDAAHLIWGVNLGVIDWNPWPVRRADLDHPDELRVDLDPSPGVPFAEVREVALRVREVLEEHGLRGFPKTSGSRGMHVYVRVAPEQGFHEVRRAALALAREVERRMPRRATSRGSGWRGGTNARASAMLPGRPISASRRASRVACSRAGRGREPAARPAAEAPAGRVAQGAAGGRAVRVRGQARRLSLPGLR